MSPERHDPFVIKDTSRERVERQKSLSKKGESEDKLEKLTTCKRKSESPEDREEAKRPTLSGSAARMIHRTLVTHKKKTKMVRDPDTGRWRRELFKSGDYFLVSGLL